MFPEIHLHGATKSLRVDDENFLEFPFIWEELVSDVESFELALDSNLSSSAPHGDLTFKRA